MEFIQSSERVKSVDLHGTEPWVLTSYYSGTVSIWNYETGTLKMSLKVSETPVRSAKFIARKQWIVTGADDNKIRVYNYETMEIVKEFVAHEDYIRSLAIHPTSPFILSSSDDKLTKMWNWENDWQCSIIFHGHSSYVMDSAFNPMDQNEFATASLDGTVKIWKIDSASPVLSFQDHSKGVNCVDYMVVDGKPYVISGSDDFSIKIWDSKNGCLKTVEGHINNITSIRAHGELPIFISASEDGSINIWDKQSFKLQRGLNYGFERVWTIGFKKEAQKVAFGFDKGFVMTEVCLSGALEE